MTGKSQKVKVKDNYIQEDLKKLVSENRGF